MKHLFSLELDEKFKKSSLNIWFELNWENKKKIRISIEITIHQIKLWIYLVLLPEFFDIFFITITLDYKE